MNEDIYTDNIELFDAMNESSDWTKDLKILNSLYSNLEEAVADEVSKGESFLTLLYHHMLKYQYQSYRQTRSWVNTILTSSRQLLKLISRNTNVYKRVSKTVDSAYSDAVNDASIETGIKKTDFPKVRPSEWSIDNVTNERFIKNFLYDFVGTPEVKNVLDARYS